MVHLPKFVTRGLKLIFSGSNDPNNACPTLVVAPSGMALSPTVQEIDFAHVGSRFVSG